MYTGVPYVRAPRTATAKVRARVCSEGDDHVFGHPWLYFDLGGVVTRGGLWVALNMYLVRVQLGFRVYMLPPPLPPKKSTERTV